MMWVPMGWGKDLRWVLVHRDTGKLVLTAR